MTRIWMAAAAISSLATAASAGTLTVFTTDSANVTRSTFLVGETILLKVIGDGQGYTSEDSILAQLSYDGAITDTLGATQGTWLTSNGLLVPSEGATYVFNQTGPVVNSGVSTSVITLLAVAVGTSTARFGGSLIDFFGIYSYSTPPETIHYFLAGT